MKKLILLLLISLPFLNYAQSSNLITIGKRDSLNSAILKETRNYFVHLPQNYDNAMFSQGRYPVLYLLDGEAHFNSVSGLVEILGSGINGTHVIPDMIVVAIPNTDRTRDLTPTHTLLDYQNNQQEFFRSSGGNNNFLHFIKDELIPHIDSSYRTMPYRVFVGHSFGGIAVINALYTIPEAFNAYIVIDPSLWWDHQVLLEKAKTYFQYANLKGKSLYLAQANTLVTGDTNVNTHFESIRSFATLLETRNRSGLRWKYDYYGDDDHGSVPFISEYAGLRFIFNDYHVHFNDIALHPEKIKEQFSQFSEETGVQFMPPEEVINNMGYNMMNNKQYALAIQYFQMNIEFYPKSANVYDSMGEALMNKGDTKRAIEYYQKSLQLNPSNDNAKHMIKRMQEKKTSR